MLRNEPEFIRFANRPITVIAGLPFYLSTATHSKKPDTWFPFGGLSPYLNNGFAKPGTELFWRALNKYFPDKLIKFFKRKESVKTFKTLIPRFGNFMAICLSMLVGGGFWNTHQGKDLKEFLWDNYKNELDNLNFLYEVKLNSIRKFNSNTPTTEINDPNMVNGWLANNSEGLLKLKKSTLSIDYKSVNFPTPSFTDVILTDAEQNLINYLRKTLPDNDFKKYANKILLAGSVKPLVKELQEMLTENAILTLTNGELHYNENNPVANLVERKKFKKFGDILLECKYPDDNQAPSLIKDDLAVITNFLKSKESEFNEKFINAFTAPGRDNLGSVPTLENQILLQDIYKIMYPDNQDTIRALTNITYNAQFKPLLTLQKQGELGSKSEIILKEEQKEQIYTKLKKHEDLLNLIKECHVFAEARQILSPPPASGIPQKPPSERLEACKVHYTKHLPFLKKQSPFVNFLKNIGAAIGTLILRSSPIESVLPPKMVKAIINVFGLFDTQAQKVAENSIKRMSINKKN